MLRASTSYGWQGCQSSGRSSLPPWPAEFGVDYGAPLGRCKETVPGSSGVFTREFKHASVRFDCKSFKGSIDVRP